MVGNFSLGHNCRLNFSPDLFFAEHTIFLDINWFGIGNSGVDDRKGLLLRFVQTGCILDEKSTLSKKIKIKKYTWHERPCLCYCFQLIKSEQLIVVSSKTIPSKIHSLRLETRCQTFYLGCKYIFFFIFISRVSYFVWLIRVWLCIFFKWPKKKKKWSAESHVFWYYITIFTKNV